MNKPWISVVCTQNVSISLILCSNRFDLDTFLKKIARNVSIWMFLEGSCSKHLILHWFEQVWFRNLTVLGFSTLFLIFLKLNPNSSYFLHWWWLYTLIWKTNGESSWFLKLGFRLWIFQKLFQDFHFDSPFIFDFKPSMMIMNKREGFLWIYLDLIGVSNKRSSNELLILLVRIETENKSVFWSSSSSNWFDSCFDPLLLTFSELWSHDFFEIVLELQFSQFDDEDSHVNLWELQWIHFNLFQSLVLEF